MKRKESRSGIERERERVREREKEREYTRTTGSDKENSDRSPNGMPSIFDKTTYRTSVTSIASQLPEIGAVVPLTFVTGSHACCV